MKNLALHAKFMRQRMAIPLVAISRLTDLPLTDLIALENGDEVDLSLDELTNLALFLGLTTRGDMRPKLPGSN